MASLNNMDLGKRTRFDDLECSMFDPPAKRSRPSPFRLSQTVPKGFMKGYTHTPELGEMGTVSFFATILPALVALLTSELCFHQCKATLVMKVAMSKSTPDGKRKNMSPYFASKPLMITSQQHGFPRVLLKNLFHQAHSPSFFQSSSTWFNV